jgi:hypothetical protein
MPDTSHLLTASIEKVPGEPPRSPNDRGVRADAVRPDAHGETRAKVEAKLDAMYPLAK